MARRRLQGQSARKNPAIRTNIRGGSRPEPRKRTKNGFDVLKTHQLRSRNDFLPCLKDSSPKRHAMLQAATASGKSYLARAYANDAFHRGLRALYITPSKDTCASFMPVRKLSYSTNPRDEFYSPSAKFANSDKVLEAVKFLTERPTIRNRDAKERYEGRAFVCSHQAVCAAFAKIWASNRLRRRFLRHAKTLLAVLDEVHHSSSGEVNSQERNQLGKVISYLDETGARLLGLTATPFRGNRDSLFPENVREKMVISTYTWAEYFETLVNLREVNVDLRVGELHGTFVSLFRQVKAQKHKAIVWLPNHNSHWSDLVANAIGSSSKEERRKQDFFNFLRKCAKEAGLDVSEKNFVDCATKHGQERNRSYLEGKDSTNDSNRVVGCFEQVKDLNSSVDPLPDVVVALNLYKEGTDVPPWSMAISLGLSNSILSIIQQFGRVVRDHVSKRGKACEYVTVLPPIEDWDDERMAMLSRDTLVTFAYVLHAISIQCTPRRTYRRFGSGGSVDADHEVSPEDIKGAFANLFSAKSREVADEVFADPQKATVIRSLADILGVKDKVATASSNLEICSIFQKKIGTVAACFNKNSVRSLHEWANEKVPPTETQILMWVSSYYAKHRAAPTYSSGLVGEPDSGTHTWASVEYTLKTRCDPPTTLSQFCYTHGFREYIETTRAQVIRWAKNYYQRTGRWPNHNTGLVEEPDSGTLTWAAVGSRLSSDPNEKCNLNRFLIRHCGKKAKYRRSSHDKKSEATIVRFLRAEVEKTGRRPSPSSKEIGQKGSDNMTWAMLNRQSLKSYGLSLAGMMDKHGIASGPKFEAPETPRDRLVSRKLTDNDREILRLIKLGYNQSKMAKHLRVSQAAVSYRINRTKKRIALLKALPVLTKSETKKDLSDFLGPLGIDIFWGMYMTSCQSEVAADLGVSQGKVRHNYYQIVDSLGEAVRLGGKKYAKYFFAGKLIRENPNVLRDVPVHFAKSNAKKAA